MVELLSIVMAVSLWHHFREPVQFFIYLILFVIPLIISALIDIRHMIIPDSISLTGIVTGFLATLYLNKRLICSLSVGLDTRNSDRWWFVVFGGLFI